jgi:hypothetical protein
MLQDSVYKNEVKCRWLALRNTILDTTYLFHYIDSLYQVLEEPAIRHYQRWPILGTYVWPNNFIGNTFQEEMEYLKSWTLARITWMDQNMFGICDTTLQNGIIEEKSGEFQLYPNPNEGSFVLQSNLSGSVEFDLFNASGQFIYHGSKRIHGAEPMHFPDLPPGIYMLRILQEQQYSQTLKLIVQ